MTPIQPATRLNLTDSDLGAQTRHCAWGLIVSHRRLESMKHRKQASLLILSVFCCTLIGSLPGQAQSGPFVSYGKHAVSPPLRDIVANPFLMPAQQVIPVRHPMPAPTFNPQPDPGLQTSQTAIVSLIATTAGLNFEGTDLDPAFCNCAPPDTNMAF